MNIELIKEKIIPIAKKYNLSLVVLFGSQATGKTHSKSDIDVAVLSYKDFDKFSLTTELDGVFERDDIELVNLGIASPTLMYAVVKDGVALYESEADCFLRWKFYAIKIWMETAWLRDLRDKKVLEWSR